MNYRHPHHRWLFFKTTKSLISLHKTCIITEASTFAGLSSLGSKKEIFFFIPRIKHKTKYEKKLNKNYNRKNNDIFHQHENEKHTSEKTNHRKKNFFNRLNRRPSFSACFITHRIISWRMEYGDANPSVVVN